MKPAVLFVWSNFGPYHADRLEAAAAALADTHRVVGIEIGGATTVYPWLSPERMAGVERVTLFPGQAFQTVPLPRRAIALIRAAFATKCGHAFLCHYERAEIFMLAALLRLRGVRVYIMTESKFDDVPRALWREAAKFVAYLPYVGGLVGGARSRDYLRFFGFRADRIALGYDTVSVERLRRLAGTPPAPGGTPFAERHFAIVARLIPKKNIAMALEAYARYCRAAGPAARALQICGAGELEQGLRRQAQELGLARAVFCGFIQAPEVAKVLASTLALILASTEEQWGLVVNEALAMGVPILCADNVGARDLLVRTAVNGFVYEPDNPEGLARLMLRLARDEEEWRRLAGGSNELAALADARNFAAGVGQLIGAPVGTPVGRPIPADAS